MANTLEFNLSTLTTDSAHYWKVEETDDGYKLAEPTEQQPEGNYFTLSANGELSYTEASGENAITFGEGNELDLTIRMGNHLKFGIANNFNAKVSACQISGVGNEAVLTGLGKGYTITASLNKNEKVTVNEKVFVNAAAGTLELEMVGDEDIEAAIESGSVVLSTDNGRSKYSGSEGGSVEYAYDGDEQGETAAAAFANGAVESITDLDQEGETVTNNKDTYEMTAYGLKRTVNGVSEFYTGTATVTNVLNIDEADWNTAKTLTNPAFSLTLGNTYYKVEAAGALTGTDEEPTSGSYFKVANGTISYASAQEGLPIKLSGKVTMSVNASGFTDNSLALYRGEENGATFTYNVTDLAATTVTNVAESDTFTTAAKGEFSFTKAGNDEKPVTFNVTSDQAAFCVDDSTVAIQSGTVKLSSGGVLSASGTDATIATDNVPVELTGEEDGEGSVEVVVTNGKVTSITGLEEGEIVTYGENTTYKVVDSTIIRTVTTTVDGAETKTITKLTTNLTTDKVNLLSETNTWVSNKSIMSSVSLDLELKDSDQYWTLSGDNKVTVATKEQTGADTNYFTLSSDGELTYTPATDGEADIISLGNGSKVTLKVDMSEVNEAPKFSVNGDLKDFITACDITGVNGATVTGFADGYTFTANLAENNSVTINEQKFTIAASGTLELSGVITTNDSNDSNDSNDLNDPNDSNDSNDLNDPKAQIQNGAIKLGVENEASTNEYYSTGGYQVKYETAQASEDEPNGATVKFENGAVSSITGIDQDGETVSVKKGSDVIIYGSDNRGIYKETGSNDRSYYTGTETDKGKVDVISATDWSAYTEVTLTNPTIAITPESGDTSYYLVTATTSVSGSRVTASKLNTEPTGSQNYFTVTKEGNEDEDEAITYKLAYHTSNINPINLSGNVTVNLNGSKMPVDGAFELYQPDGEEADAATFTYNVTALKSGAAFTNVSSGDTFAAAAGSYSFTMAKNEEVQSNLFSYSVTAASNNFVADASAVAMYSGTATLSSGCSELFVSGKDKTDDSDNVTVEFIPADGNDDSTAKVTVANGEVTSITGLQNGDSVTFAGEDKTETYTKTDTGFRRTVDEKSEEYTGTITDVIAAIKKTTEWYALGDVTFNDGVVLDLGTVTTNSYYKLTKITEEGATVVKATTQPGDLDNYFTVSQDGEVSYHQATGDDDTLKATANAKKATVKFAAQNLDKLTLSGQGAEANGVKNYEVSGVKKDAEVNGVADGDVLKTLGSATVNGFEYVSTAGALEIRGLAAEEDTEPDPEPETDPIINSNVGSEVAAKTALYSGTVNVIGTQEDPDDDEDSYTKTLTVGGADGATETVTITSSVTTTTGAVVTATKGAITVIKDLEKGETIEHTHNVDGSNVVDTYTYNGTSIIKTTIKGEEGRGTYTYDVAAVATAKNTNVLTIKDTQWEDVTEGITAGEKTVLNITLPTTIGQDGAFYEVTGSKSTNIKVAAKATTTAPEGSNYFQFSKSDEGGTYSLSYNPAEDAQGSFSIKLGAAQANINATAIASGSTLNLSNGGEGYLPTYNVTGLKAGAGVTSDGGVGFTVTTAALKAKEIIKIDDVSYTAGANGALKFEKTEDDGVVFQSGTLKLASTGEAGVTARYVYTDSSRQKVTTTATIKSTAAANKDGVLLTATAAGGLTVKDLEEGETVTIQVGDDDEYTYQLNADGKLTRTDANDVTSTYTGVAKFAATADVFAAAINTNKWVETYTVEDFDGELTLKPTGVNATGRSAATYYKVVLDDSDDEEGDSNKKVKSISETPEYTVPTDANYFAVTATGAVTYHTNEYQKADLSNATVKVDYAQATASGAKFTTVARPKNAASTVNNVKSYEYVAKAGMTFTGITQEDKVTANLTDGQKVTVNGTAFTSAGTNDNLEVGIIKNELNKEVAALKSASTILVKGTYYVATNEESSYAKVVSTGNGVNVTFDDNNGITSISGFDKNEKIEVYTPGEEGNLPKTANTTYQVNAAGTMVIKTDENGQKQAALEDGAITLSSTQWEDLAFAGTATLTLNDKTTSGDYGVDTKLYNSATAAASAISEGATDKTTVGAVATESSNSFTADESFKGNVKITTSGTKTWELTGSAGNDTFTLGTQATVKGSKGNDTITSSAKADTFDYTTGDLTGEDMIKSFTSTAKVVDTIKVGDDAEFTLGAVGTNVELKLGDEGKEISLVGMVGKEIDVAKGDNAVTAYIVGNSNKANTFTLTNTQLENESKTYSLIGGSAVNDTFKVTQNNTNQALDLDLSERAEKVEIFTATGSKGAVKITNAGNFVSITGGNAGDTISAGGSTTWISGGKGADSIDFGEESDEDATGIIYQLNAGDGIDTIVNFDKDNDKIYLGKGAVTKVETVTEDNEVKAVKITAGTDSVVLKDVTAIKDIKNDLYTSAGKQISDAWYYNSDGVLPAGATFAGNTITLTKDYQGENDKFDLSSINDFSGWVAANSSTYKSLNITATAVQTALLIKGSGEANIIKAGGKVGLVTSIDGAGGNDTLYGGAGTDAFIFEENHGQDTVYNFISGKDVVSISSSESLTHTTTGANLTINTDGDNTITLIGKANTRIDILGEGDESVAPASDYSTAYYFGKTTGTNTYSVNAKDMLNAHFFGSDDAKDTLTITANGVLLSDDNGALKETVGDKTYIKVDLSDSDKFRFIDELNAQAVLLNLHIKSGYTVEDEEDDEDAGTKTTTIKAGKGSDSIECAKCKDVIYYGGYGFGNDTISGFNATTDKLWVANTIKSVAALEDENSGVVITFGSGTRTSTLTVIGDNLTAQALDTNKAVIASATATASATSWTKAYSNMQ